MFFCGSTERRKGSGWVRAVIPLLVVATVVSCSTASLSLAPRPPTDLTVMAPARPRFSSMMVLPPRGSDRGQVTELADVERVLLSGGIRVISSGVTARVVEDSTGGRVETAANLSDLERALILARKSGAEALLQVIDIGWTDSARPFVRDGDRFDEVSRGAAVDGSRLLRVREAIFLMRARLINVENGEIVMSLDVSQGTSRVIDPPKEIKVESNPMQGVQTQAIDTDTTERRRTVVDQVMRTFLSRLASGPLTTSAP